MPILEAILPFINGGIAGCTATSCIQPLDMIKVKIQLKNEAIANAIKAGKPMENSSVSPIVIAKEIYSQGGIKKFYTGIDSAIARQLLYGTARLGLYRTLYERVKKSEGSVSILKKMLCSFTAGTVGAFVGNPADLALVRMQGDLQTPKELRRNYKHVFDAIRRIIAEEGVLTLWRGSLPSVFRGISMNIGMLTSFDETRERLNAYRGTKDQLTTRMMASGVAGFCAAFCCLPFDNAKTKIQKMSALPDGTMPYKNVFDCLGKSIKAEGITGLWIGFPVFYIRVAPHAMISLIVMEYLNDFGRRKLGKTN